MTAIEWRAVSLGMQRNQSCARAFFKRQNALFDQLPKAEREAILAAERAVETSHSKYAPTYWIMLWMEDREVDLIAPEDGEGLAEKLIAERAKAGCRCAQAREMLCDAWSHLNPEAKRCGADG